MAESVEDEIKMRFSSTESDLQADVLAELQSIMRLGSIDVEELWYKWESYIMMMGSNEVKLNIETARNLKKNILKDLESESRSKVHKLPSKNRSGANLRNVTTKTDVLNILGGFIPSTPMIKERSEKKIETSFDLASSLPKSKSPSRADDHRGLDGISSTSFQQRDNINGIIEILNEHLPKIISPTVPFGKPRVRLTANSEIKKLSYKTMAMKCSEASEILDDRIDEYMFLIQDHYKFEDSVFGSAASESIHEIVAVGRIATDALDGKLNTFSLVLETSRRMGAGLRIPLKVESLQNYQFFPGQIVALKGINTTGENFVVSEVLESPLLPSAASTLATLRQHNLRLKDEPESMDVDSSPVPLNVIVGAGPYTSNENLDFEPLKAICNQAANMLTDTLILIGPFLDTYHPKIASGDFDLSMEKLLDSEIISMPELFRHFITPYLNQILITNPHITIILVPSVRDTISKHVSWPQEPFSRKDLGLPKSVKIVGNPMVISLNEVSFGLSSQDILTELRISEVVGKKPKDISPFTRFSKYLIEQRSFFPVFPPIDKENFPKPESWDGVPIGAMLDTSFLKLGEIINFRPDVLIIPSTLPPFAKVVENVLVINPGYLWKENAVGTYAKIAIQSAELNLEGEDSSMITHKVYERARVEILQM
ncbi:DNA polymerase alpha subunit B [Erysiphe neolycopersici]|uniref:DNA polymerase alpha subunit B n=1 Tax=Erysiphe neolycopersici TaxID=212602 RepID=A0A420HED8_9PEZI|nr:DNA polymerase alpha subunit B [Erysiphe neolycopersici]